MEIRIDKDPLGTRIKENYEHRTRYYVPRRTYSIIRLDGCHFKTYTEFLEKPFDNALIEDMDAAIMATLPYIQGAVFAYTQSDEISILLTDFDKPTTSAWFDGNVQKICSVSASSMTAAFNYFRLRRDMSQRIVAGDRDKPWPDFRLANFDSRVFTIPDRIEVMNYFIWRNQDCSRNSVSMVAQSQFTHKELQGKSTSDMHEMLCQKGINWATDFADGQKNGRLIVKESCFNLESITVENIAPPARTRWISEGAWKFTEDKDKLLDMIPKYKS
jgi:tRNA(His) 5'-end guanylyltransferase